jgi:hypothetical protein
MSYLIIFISLVVGFYLGVMFFALLSISKDNRDEELNYQKGCSCSRRPDKQ